MNIQHQRVIELCNELRLGGVAAQIDRGFTPSVER